MHVLCDYKKEAIVSSSRFHSFGKMHFLKYQKLIARMRSYYADYEIHLFSLDIVNDQLFSNSEKIFDKSSEKNIHIVTGIHTIEDAKAATHTLLGSTSKLDGIIATNDLIAMGVGEVVSKEQPEIAVVSFDDFPSAEMLGIKTLDHDPQRLGRLAADVLLKRISDPVATQFMTEIMKLEMKKASQHSQKAAANG